ncbi:MAG: hypothetical protein MUF34_25085 [Polyangiaceae bacterium]|nr:hypothetical protein [Polyangiaceae bacterium]
MKIDSQRRSILGVGLGLLFKLAWWSLVICLPLVGAWVASSLSAYANRPPSTAALAGLLLFPIVPFLWEGLSAWRRRRASPPRFLTLGDRIVLRTLALSFAFLATVLGAFPREVFTALTVRGDWALEGREGPNVEEVRRQLFAMAGRLEWLYLYTKEKNPYGESDQGPSPDGSPSASAKPSASTPPPSPPPLPSAASSTARPTPASTAPPSSTSAGASSTPTPAVSTPPIASAIPAPSGAPTAAEDGAGAEAKAVAWPLPATLHPLVASLPPEHEASPASVARYLAERERDPIMLVKALHDYVADRIAYDAPALLARNIPDQGAAAVFRERKGVCAGYSRLFAELGRLAGVEVAYVVGDARTADSGDDLSGPGHAWNAVRVGGAWRLVDVTWDAGSIDGATFTKRYQSDYLLTPPEIFGRTHLPKGPSWQLLPEPLSRGDFLRQPLLEPSFFALGLSLHDPDRSQVTVERTFGARLQNPRGVSLLAVAVDKRTEAETRCEVERGPESGVRCDLPAEGTYQVRFFASPERVGRHPYVGQIEVNRER